MMSTFFLHLERQTAHVVRQLDDQIRELETTGDDNYVRNRDFSIEPAKIERVLAALLDAPKTTRELELAPTYDHVANSTAADLRRLKVQIESERGSANHLGKLQAPHVWLKESRRKKRIGSTDVAGLERLSFSLGAGVPGSRLHLFALG